jgi:hypothetical protein
LAAILAVMAAALGCGKKAAAPLVATDLKPRPPAEQRAYALKQIQKASREGAGDEARLTKNEQAHFGCLEKNKDDDCRFMLCSPYAIYAGDELFQMGRCDEALGYYGAAQELLDQEVAGSIERRNQREADYQAAAGRGEVDRQETRHYLYRRAILAQNLYRNYAELARLLERFALVFEKLGKPREAANVREVRDALLDASAAEYAEYFQVRASLLPMLDPKDPETGSNYLAVIADLDGLLEIRNF